MLPARAVTASGLTLALAGASLLIAPTAAVASNADDPMIIVEYEGSRIFIGDPNQPEDLALLAENADLPEDIWAGDIDSAGAAYLLVGGEGGGCSIVGLDLRTGLTTSTVPVDLGGLGDDDFGYPLCGYGFDIDANDVAWITVDVYVPGTDEEDFDVTWAATVDLATGTVTMVGYLLDESGDPEMPVGHFVSEVEAISIYEGNLAVVTEAGDLYGYALDSITPQQSFQALATLDIGIGVRAVWASDSRGSDLWVLTYSGTTNELWHLVDGAGESSGILQYDGDQIDVGAMFFGQVPVTEPALTLSTDTARPGDTITVTGENFPADEELALELHSLPMTLGTVTVATDGTFSTSVTIPSNAPAGNHSIVALASGDPLASAAITLAALLAATGADTDVALASGTLLLLLGVLVITAARARRA